MSGTGAGGPAPQDRRVWLLGNTHPSANRSIGWDDEPFPYLGDPDVLVVDLTTLTRQVLERIGKAKLDRVRPLIGDKILNHGTVVVITQPLLQVVPGLGMGEKAPLPLVPYQRDPIVYSNYQILPTQLATKDVPDGKIIVADHGHMFGEYVAHVRRFHFYIEHCSPWYISGAPEASPVRTELIAVEGQGIRDNSGHYLGLTLAAEVVEDFYDTVTSRRGAGRLVFLPPPTEPANDAIGRILSALGKAPLRAEAPPAWAERLSLGRAGEYRARAASLRGDVAKIQREIGGLDRQAGEILAHRRLLYSKGVELEDAVVRAFESLGFGDIEPMGGADREDAAFGMGGGTGYMRGVVEAKGADGATQMQHILQCKKWATLRAVADGKPSKGIFVPNQHRLHPYPESLEARVKIEPNQLEQATLNDICIIPACALFEAVKRILGGEEPDRAKTAARIAASTGVLVDVL